MAFSLLAKLGLDTQQFQRQLKNAERSVNRFTSLLGKIGIGAAAFQVVRWFQAVVRNANEAETGTDRNIDAIQRFSAQLSKVGEAAMSFGTAVLGGLNRFGEAIGDSISKVFFGATQEQLDALRRSEAAVREAEQRLAAIRERNEKSAKQAVEVRESNEKKLADLRRAEMSDLERIADRERELLQIRERMAELRNAEHGLTGRGELELAQLESQSLDIQIQIANEKQRQAESVRKETEEVRARIGLLQSEMAFDRLSDAEKLEELERRRIDLMETREKALWENTAEAARDFSKSELQIIENLQEQERIRQRIADQEKRDAEIIADLQRRITEEESAFQLMRLDGASRVEEITRRIADLNQRIEARRQDGDEAGALRLELERNRLERDRLQTEEQITRELERQKAEITQQMQMQQEMARRESQAFRERSTVSLSDLASGRFGRGAASDARRIQEIEERARQARVRGNEGLADRLTQDALQRRGRISGLSEFERDPQAAFKEALEDTNNAIRETNERIFNELNALRTEPVK